MSDIVQQWREYWRNYAEAFAQPLQSNGLVNRFVTNPNVTGAYAEAWVGWIARTMLAPRFRISTGAVVQPSDSPNLKDVPQCDLIIWDSSVLPALFEQGEFAIVSRVSACAVVEIERTVSNLNEFKKQLLKRQKRLNNPQAIAGVVVHHPTPLFENSQTGLDDSDETGLGDSAAAGFAESDAIEPPKMMRLLDKENRADATDLIAFLNFLSSVAGHQDDGLPLSL